MLNIRNTHARSDLRSQSLDLLRFPLAVVVLVVHVFTISEVAFGGQRLHVGDFPLFEQVRCFLDAFLRGQSVPIYYFISGYVFFLGAEMTRKVYVRKLNNRVKSLLLPYVIWTMLAVLLLIVFTCVPLGMYRAEAATLTFSWKGLLSAFWAYHGELEGRNVDSTFPLNVPLWFVRNLMVVVLCTPLLYWLLKRAKFYTVMLLGLIWLVVPFCGVNTFSFEVSFFFFACGAYMSICKKDMLSIFGRHFRLFTILYVALSVLYMMVEEPYPQLAMAVKQCNVLAGLFFAYGFSIWLLQHGVCRPNAFLSSASFFVYVSHSLIVYKIFKLLALLICPRSDLSLLLTYVLTIVVTLSVLLVLFYLLLHYAPKVLNVMTGKKL